MSDISLKVRADKLGKSLENLAPRVEAEINQAIESLAHAAYTKMVATVQASRLSDPNKTNYLKNLKFEVLGNNTYLIYLEGEWPNKLENGTGSYSLRELLLKSQKIVQVGSRAGQPWVQKNKEGGKFAHVPFDHKASAPTGDLSKDIKSLMALGRNGVAQPIGKTFKDEFGKPLQGKVAQVSKGDVTNPNLAGLVKYQHVHKSGKVSSTYMTFRTISEHSRDWVHPGLAGLNVFQDAEEEVTKEMDNILKVLLG